MRGDPGRPVADSGTRVRHLINLLNLRFVQPRTFRYHAFGLSIDAERPIDGLAPRHDAVAPDVRVRFGTRSTPYQRDRREPVYVSVARDDRGGPLAEAWETRDGAKLQIVMSGGAEFVVDRGGTEIAIHARGAADADIVDWLTGPIFAYTLRRRGVIPLHASAVCVDGGALLLIGRSGTGKSTLAALLDLKGCRALTDDLGALAFGARGWTVQSGQTHLRARPGSVEGVAAVAGRLGDLRPTPDGAYVDLPLSSAASRQPVPLRAVYYLDHGASESSGTCRIEPVTGAEAFLALVRNAWATRWQDREGRALEFDWLTRLSAQVPMRRVPMGDPRPGADAVVEAVLTDWQERISAGNAGRSTGQAVLVEDSQ